MKNVSLLSLFLCLFVFFSCGSEDPGVRRTALMNSFDQLADQSTGLLNEPAAKAYVADADAFAKDFAADTLAALPLYRAAEVARALGEPAKAIDFYQRVINNYPGFSKAPEAHFMLAFSYDEDLNDLDKAREEYQTFIKTYPNHGFADDAEMLLSNLGKSDEEILRELEAKLAQPQE